MKPLSKQSEVVTKAALRAADMLGINPLITERGATHGDFSMNADVAQEMKALFRGMPSWHEDLTCRQKEALDMIASKIGRILSGNPNHKDHWLDVIGYATLAVEEIQRADIQVRPPPRDT